MNYLAHLHLSNHHPMLTIGNLIADFINNKQVEIYSPAVQTGIHLHRFIDTYTDQHPVVRQGTERLRPTQGKYAPVVIDILFDHLLAVNWEKYSVMSLADFAQKQYILLEENLEILPMKLQKKLPGMIKGNWLEGYGKETGIRYTLERMDERTKFPSFFVKAYDTLQEFYPLFEKEFNTFYPELMQKSLKFQSDNFLPKN